MLFAQASPSDVSIVSIIMQGGALAILGWFFLVTFPRVLAAGDATKREIVLDFTAAMNRETACRRRFPISLAKVYQFAKACWRS